MNVLTLHRFGGKPADEAKPFKIPKREIWEDFKRVESIAAIEANLSGNLYKLWNRMSSGSYFPPPVRRVDIPKAGGGTRLLDCNSCRSLRPGRRSSLPGADSGGGISS
jgi:hypothetical protein